MNKILSDYLSIYKKFPLNEFFSREERKLRHSLMVDWEKQDNEDLPSLDELIEFTYKYQKEIAIIPLFFNRLKTVWEDDIKNGYKFAKLLLDFSNSQNILISKLDLEPIDIANQVLKFEEDNYKAMEFKYNILKGYYEFSLHELPWGVLIDDESLEEEMRELKNFEELGKKLNKNQDDLINDCKKYYSLWFEYLKGDDRKGIATD